MPIKARINATSSYSFTDLIGIIEFLTTDAEPDQISATQISGTGAYRGLTGSFVINGTGFSTSMIGGEEYLTSGTLQEITFNSSAGAITFETINIDMSVFGPIIAADDSGSSPNGIENFLMMRAWDIKLGNADDFAPRGTTLVEGSTLNLRGNDVIRGMGGDDNLFAGNGKDKMFGGSGKDKLDGGRGNDLLKGGNGNDRLLGDKGRDKLFGEKGKDVLKGGTDKDVLDGGRGDDTLKGGGGSDRFVFKDNYGRDRVTDFDANNNKEDIDLRGVSAITGFQNLKNNFMTTQGSNVVIDDEAGTEIVLVGVDINDLGKGDFLF